MGNIQRPSQYLNWTDGNASKVVAPTAAFALAGCTAGTPISFQNFNWLLWMADQWIQYLDASTNSTSSIVSTIPMIRLINGGSWSYVASTGTLTWSSAFNLAVPSVADADNACAANSIALSDGQVAYVTANIPFSTTGSTTNGSNQITGVAEELGITVGMTVTGSGIPGSTTVTAINTSTNVITISNNASATASGVTLTFCGTGALTVQAAAESALVPNPTTIIIARRVGAVCYLGVNASQMLLHDGESRILMEEGYIGIYRGTAGQNLSAGQVVYISPGTGVDSGRTAGDVYPADSGATNGGVRSVWVGFVMTAATTGNPVQVITGGLITGLSILTVGALYYIDPTTPGGITSTKPSTAGQFVAPVGVALSTTTLWLNSSLAGTVSLVTTTIAYPNFFCANETDLSNAITSATSNGGGVICLLSSFTISSGHTIPSNVLLIGRKGGSIITVASGGSLTISTDSDMQDVWLTTALSSGTLLTMSGDRCNLKECRFTVPSNSTTVCVNITGSLNLIFRSAFFGVAAPSTGVGIQLSSGSGNLEQNNVFAT